jgi:anti-anti-sigma regulatory factor
VIKLSGELEIGRRAEIRAALHVGGGEKAFLIDFSEVTYADSTAVAELVRFHAEAAAAGVPVAVVIGNRQFARLLQYAGARRCLCDLRQPRRGADLSQW